VNAALFIKEEAFAALSVGLCSLDENRQQTLIGRYPKNPKDICKSQTYFKVAWMRLRILYHAIRSLYRNQEMEKEEKWRNRISVNCGVKSTG